MGRLGSQGSKGKKVDLRNSEQLLRVVFQLFVGQKNFKDILASALKSYIKWLLYFFFFLKRFEKIEKIGYRSNFILSVIQIGAFKSHLRKFRLNFTLFCQGGKAPNFIKLKNRVQINGMMDNKSCPNCIAKVHKY